MRRRLGHWFRVFKHAVFAAGWVAGLVTVIVGGSVVTAGGLLLHSHHRTLATAVFAAGLLAAVMEGSYRVWDATDRALQTTRARIGELDTPEARDAYLIARIDEAGRLRDDVAALSEEEFLTERSRIEANIIHFENRVREDLRESFGREAERLFDSEAGFDLGNVYPQGQEGQAAYLSRRITRLEQLRGDL